MEVDILISSSLEKISSPCNLTAAIGVPSGVKLRLFRDPVREGQSRMVLCCEKSAASRLRKRFSAPRLYTHDGQLLSLTFVGMRPIPGRHPESLLRGLHNCPTATKPHELKEAQAAGGAGGAEKPSRAWVRPPRSSSRSAGVEFALDWVEQQFEDDRMRVPGITDLYEEFVRAHEHYNGGEEKSCDLMEDGEWTTSSATKTIHSRQRPRLGDGEEKGREEEEEEEEEKHSSDTDTLRRWKLVVHSYKKWCRHRQRVVSIEDVAAALNRISSSFADAPKPVERIGVVSLLAKIYADGTAFADNSPRCCEALDRLGIVPWHARTFPRFPAQATPTEPMAPPSTAPGKGWLRVLGHVVGLVRAFIDFGTFVQVYVAAAERERLVVSSMVVSSTVAAVNDEKTPDGAQGEDERGDKDVSPCRGGPDSTTEDGHGLHLAGDGSRERRASPKMTASAAETVEHHRQGGNEEPPADSYPLPWLFPNSTEEGGRLAFNRHAVCGSGVHAMITLEAAARIVRDAGKVFPAERAWRWRCEKKTFEGGRLLTFKDFVEMCEGLKEYMTAASHMSLEDHFSSTPVPTVGSVDSS